MFTDGWTLEAAARVADLTEDRADRTDDAIDGLPVGEGTFLPCAFWLVDALDGRLDEATELFERLLGVRNDVGLLAGEYDPRQRRMLGNFPQAFARGARQQRNHPGPSLRSAS